MTLAQLQSFVLVAQLGSVKAAAAQLEVTEPAVSVAVAALRRELGDELFVREGRGIAFTPGGRRLAALAAEILGLAEQARRSVQDTPGQARRMHVVTTGVVAEHVGPMIDAFTARDEGLEIEVEPVSGTTFADMLEHRRADVALGPHPGPERSSIATVPFLRCQMVIVAAPEHRLAGRPAIGPAELSSERWLVGQPDLDSSTATGQFFARYRVEPAEIASYTSSAAAIAAAVAGDGVALVLTHSVVDEVRRRALVRLDVRGTPILEIWHASTLGLGRAMPAALALQRFATTSDATHAISSRRAGTVSTRVRPKVHVTLWRSVAAERDAAANPGA